MRAPTNERLLVHVVDDDASLRGRFKALFDPVGLQKQIYATEEDFLSENSRR
jgi:FixJ family two-component response regulator